MSLCLAVKMPEHQGQPGGKGKHSKLFRLHKALLGPPGWRRVSAWVQATQISEAVQRQFRTQERSLADVIPPSLAPELREREAEEAGSKCIRELSILSILITQTVVFRSALQLS